MTWNIKNSSMVDVTFQQKKEENTQKRNVFYFDTRISYF